MKRIAIWIFGLAVFCLASGTASAGIFSSGINLPSGARVERDVAYGPGEKQRIDVYIPAGAHDAPIIVMVHGGAWLYGDKSNAGVVENKAAHWLPKGMIFVSVGYPLVPDADPVTQASDVAKAIALVQSKAASWGGDASRIVLMGHSAGAHLVALVAADPAIAEGAGTKPWLGTVVLDSAALDLPAIMQRKHYRFYDRAFGEDPTYWDKASPLQQLKVAPHPMLIVCSTQRKDSCPPSDAFAAKAVSLGGRASVLREDKTHKEINVDVGLPGDYTARIDGFIASLGVK